MAGAGGIEDAAGGEQVVRSRPLVEGAQADRSEQREAREEIGLGDADARALRGRRSARRCGCRGGAAASRPARRPPPSPAPAGSAAARPAATRRSPAGCPSSVLSALRACCSAACSCGIVARVLSSSVVAWVGSSSDVAPFLKRDCGDRQPVLLDPWRSRRACTISTSKVRMAT